MASNVAFKCPKCGHVWEVQSTFWENMQNLTGLEQTDIHKQVQPTTCPNCGNPADPASTADGNTKSGGW